MRDPSLQHSRSTRLTNTFISFLYVYRFPFLGDYFYFDLYRFHLNGTTFTATLEIVDLLKKVGAKE